MIRRIALIISLSLIAAIACADGGLVPLTPEQGGAQEGTSLVRGETTLTLYQRPDGEPLRLTVDARQIGSYEHPVVARWPADAGVPLREVSVEAGQTGVLDLPDCPPGPVEVALDTGQNAAGIACNGPLAIPASLDGLAHFIIRVGTLHFFVPEGTERFTASIRGQGREENAKLTIMAPDGEQVASATSIGSQGAELRVDVPPEHAGALWSLTASEADTGVFEEVFIGLSREVPQYLSLRPDGALVPFVTGLRQPPRYVGSDAEPTVRFALTRPVAEGTLSALAGDRTMSVDASEGTIEAPVTPDITAVQVTLEAPEMPTVSATTTVALRGPMLFVGGYQPLITAEPIGASQQETGARLTPALQEMPPGVQVEASLRRTHPSYAPSSATAEVVQTERVADWDGSPIDLMPDEEPGDGAYEWQIVLRDGSGRMLDWNRTSFLWWDGTYFADRTPEAEQATPAWSRSPWIAFTPEAADAIPYRYRPSQEDADRRIRMMATPGEFESATFGLLALRDTRGLRVMVEDLRAPSGERIPADAWEVRWARYWPQRTGWTATAFEVKPEMLERRDTMDLAALEPAQVWLTLKVPEDTPPGRYQGRVRVTDGRGNQGAHRIVLSVLPFTLMEPAEYHWGLYTDSVRWRQMPERRVRAEMRDFVDHGITSAMMYPPYHARFSMEGDQVRIDSAEFEKYMRWALQEGLRPPTVISMQLLGNRVMQLVPDAEPRGPQFERVYKQIVRHFADLGEREGWGEMIWHAVDEPNRKYEERIEAAYEELSWFKDLGLSTFTTVNDPLVAEERLDPVLDVRCYYARFLGGSALEQQQRSAETADSGDRLWLYGTGCYIGMDGTTMPNRWLAGFMLRRTEAEGIWCWTLQRAKGDIYNDFDGEGHRESKEACTTYVSEDGSEMVPTLQWEGHREGVDDFRYIYTLQKLAAERGEPGQQALAELDGLLDGVPWGLRPGDFSAADADELRGRVAKLIRNLGQ